MYKHRNAPERKKKADKATIYIYIYLTTKGTEAE